MRPHVCRIWSLERCSGEQEFYSLISGTRVVLENGCVDLTFLAVLGGYKFHSQNMTAMRVQVMGSLLNKME